MAEIVFLDTNVLVYARFDDSPGHAQTVAFLQRLAEAGAEACISSQVLAEFYAVVTSPRRVRRPLAPAEAAQATRSYLDTGISVLYPSETTLRLALQLASARGVQGQAIFDAFIVATMLDHGVRTIVTANEADFRAFEGLTVLNPLR